MLDEAAKALISYGALGVVALAAIAAAVGLYRDAKVERERNRVVERELHEKYRAEHTAIIDRHVAKSETWNTRYHELAEAQVKVLERIEERLEREALDRERMERMVHQRGGG